MLAEILFNNMDILFTLLTTGVLIGLIKSIKEY